LVGFTDNPELWYGGWWVAGMVTHNCGGLLGWSPITVVGLLGWSQPDRVLDTQRVDITHGSQGGTAGIPGRVICMEVCCDESGLFVNRRLREGRTWGSGVGAGNFAQGLGRNGVVDPLCSLVGSGNCLHWGLGNLFCENARSLAWLTRL